MSILNTSGLTAHETRLVLNRKYTEQSMQNGELKGQVSFATCAEESPLCHTEDTTLPL